MNSIFGTLELRSFNLFPFYLTSVVFSMAWKSRIMRQSKIAREVKFTRTAHGWQFYIKVPGCWKWRACIVGKIVKFVVTCSLLYGFLRILKRKPQVKTADTGCTCTVMCRNESLRWERDKEVRSLNGNSSSLTFRVQSQILLVFTWRHQNSNLKAICPTEILLSRCIRAAEN